jgi:hypothetical protein
MNVKYAAITVESKRIFTPFFDTTQELEKWIDNSDCEPFNMFRVLDKDYSIIFITHNLIEKLVCDEMNKIIDK